MSPPEISQQITFLHAEDLKAAQEFYSGILGLTLARDQGACLIFKVNHSAYLGFCKHIEPISEGRKVILTLVSDDVDGWYEALKNKGAAVMSPPQFNPDFGITHFFLQDPNGYWVEFQSFETPL